MSVATRVAAAFQQLFGPLAVEANRAHPVVLRQRIFTDLPHE